MNFIRVEGFPDYVIHPVGTILRIHKHHTREMKHSKRPDGYMRICLCNNGKQKLFLVHRLLALHFIPNPENKPCIDHINGVKDDNRLENLEWVTMTENNRRREYVKNPHIITKGGILKRKSGSWAWYYRMSGKQITKSMKNREDLQKFRKETLLKYNINL